MREIVGAAVVLVALFVTCPVWAASKPVPRFGVNHDFVWTPDDDIPGLVKAMKEANVQAVRIPIRWTVVEPERGKWDFAKVDRVVREIRDAKIEILGTLMSVPAWASGIDPKNIEGFWDCFPPLDDKDWSEFVKRCAIRYKDDIHYWEIWNEQNGPDFYKPMPDSGEYVWLLKAAHKAIKDVDPQARVVLGGLQMNGIVPNPWLPIPIINFLHKIYYAGGKPYFDVVNIHPYVTTAKDQGPAYAAKLVRDAVEVMKIHGDAGKPLWITETGTYTDEHVTEQDQAAHLEGVYSELGNIPEVAAIYWFTLRDYGSAICGGEDTMGLIAKDDRRKPAFDSYRKIAGEPAKAR